MYWGRRGFTTGRTYLAVGLRRVHGGFQPSRGEDRKPLVSIRCEVNGMLIEENPSAHGQLLDEDLNDLEFYGVDPKGPSPFEDSNNNVTVVVPPVTLPVEHQSVKAKVLEQIDPVTSKSYHLTIS